MNSTEKISANQSQPVSEERKPSVQILGAGNADVLNELDQIGATQRGEPIPNTNPQQLQGECRQCKSCQSTSP